jgi:hypothetical protein
LRRAVDNAGVLVGQVVLVLPDPGVSIAEEDGVAVLGHLGTDRSSVPG